jgi:crossover junction endodeoxyribonuclease RusA
MTEFGAAAAGGGRGCRSQAAPLSFAFTLPWPPSVNHYFVERAVVSRQTGKPIVMKHPGREGLEYRVAVSNEIMAQRIPRNRLTGRLAVVIIAHPPDRRARDLDNLLKATLDALKHANVYRDDGDIDDLRIMRGTIKPGGALRVIVDEIPGGAMVSGDLLAGPDA